jgi:hypothetical protein
MFAQQPINYGIKTPGVLNSFEGGLKVGGDISTINAVNNQRLLIQDVMNRLQNPNATAEDYAKLSAFLPKDAGENLRSAGKMLDDKQQQVVLERNGKIFAAFKSDQPEIAVDLIKQRTEELRNSGDAQGAEFLDRLGKVATINPDGAKRFFGYSLSQLPGGDKVIEAANKLDSEKRLAEQAPAALKEANAKAQSAAVAAKYAESKAAADLEKTGWETKKLANDITISKLNANIAAADSVLKREENGIKRQELRLKIDEMSNKRDETISKKASEVIVARNDIANMSATLDKIINTPNDVVRAASGPFDSSFFSPTIQRDVANFEELVKQVAAQAFITQVQKVGGMTGLAEAEGNKITEAFKNFSLRQDDTQLIKNAKEAKNALSKIGKALSVKYGVPDVDLTSSGRAPVGVTQNQWDHMTPDQRALWE